MYEAGPIMSLLNDCIRFTFPQSEHHWFGQGSYCKISVLDQSRCLTMEYRKSREVLIDKVDVTIPSDFH